MIAFLISIAFSCFNYVAADDSIKPNTPLGILRMFTESPETVTKDIIDSIYKIYHENGASKMPAHERKNMLEILYYVYSAAGKMDLAYFCCDQLIELDRENPKYMIMKLHASARSRNRDSVAEIAEMAKRSKCSSSVLRYIEEVRDFSFGLPVKLITKNDLLQVKKDFAKSLYFEVATLHANIAIYSSSYMEAHTTLLDVFDYCGYYFINPEEVHVLMSRSAMAIGGFDKAIASAHIAYSINKHSIQTSMQLCKTLFNSGSYYSAKLMCDRIELVLHGSADARDRDYFHFLKYVIYSHLGVSERDLEIAAKDLPDSRKYIIAALRLLKDPAANADDVKELRNVLSNGKKLTTTDLHIILSALGKHKDTTFAHKDVSDAVNLYLEIGKGYKYNSEHISIIQKGGSVLTDSKYRPVIIRE
jgi:tetratricopeptide (TPR) repeat protein